MVVSNTKVLKNSARGIGGAIFMWDSVSLHISGQSYIAFNRAGQGGGRYVLTRENACEREHMRRVH